MRGASGEDVRSLLAVTQRGTLLRGGEQSSGMVAWHGDFFLRLRRELLREGKATGDLLVGCGVRSPGADSSWSFAASSPTLCHPWRGEILRQESVSVQCSLSSWRRCSMIIQSPDVSCLLSDSFQWSLWLICLFQLFLSKFVQN
jgi:hypothetical protein